MDDLTAEALGEKWLSLTNEQRSELLSQRRENQLNEKAPDKAPTNHRETAQASRPTSAPGAAYLAKFSLQNEESGHAS